MKADELAGATRAFLSGLDRGFWIAVAAIVAVVAIVAALGGFAPAGRAEAPIAVLQPGEAHANDQLTVRVLGAAVTDDPDLLLDEDEVALLLDVELTSHWDRPLQLSDVTDNALAVNPAAEGAPSAVRAADGERQRDDLQPELPLSLTLLYEYPAADLAPGDEIRVVVADPTLRQLAVLGDAWVWDHYTPAAEITLTAEDRTGMAP